MKHRLAAVLVGLLCMAVIAVGCAPKQVLLTVGTGGTAGVYYPLGTQMARIWNENIKGMNATAISTGASAANARAIQKGEQQLALAQNDISFYALNGMEMFSKDGKLTKLKGICGLYPEVIQVVSLKSANINSIADLRGKRVAVGAPGSGTEANARQILEAWGLKYTDLAKADYLSFAEAAANLKDGHIDAAFITAGVPTSAVQEIAATHPLTIVPVTGANVIPLKTKYPFYTAVNIPAGIYKGQDSAIETVAVLAMLVVSADLDEKVVYNLTKALFENLPTLGKAHARGNDVKLEKALEGMSLPVHPGAKKYFDEKKVK
ncbi:MAG: TAXI family TRAP transporter solute-binding subunit [Bacillota bacterium]